MSRSWRAAQLSAETSVSHQIRPGRRRSQVATSVTASSCAACSRRAPSPATGSDDQCPAGKVAGSSHPATSSCSPTTNKALTAATSAWCRRGCRRPRRTALAAARPPLPTLQRSDGATRSSALTSLDGYYSPGQDKLLPVETSKHKTANECSWRQLFIRLRAWSVADEFGRPPPSGSKPSGGSRAIARQRLPRDRAAYGVSSHSGNARYRGASGTGDDPPSSLATAANTSRAVETFGRPHLCSDAYNSLRLERVCSPSSASPSSIARRSAVPARETHRPGDA